MLTGLLASVRELRNPLTVGYSVLFSLWLLTGDAVTAAARNDPLGRRLLAAVDSIGDAAQLALFTFVAAIVGSVLWHIGIARLVRLLAVVGRHPDWPRFIDEAKEAVRDYEQYKVVSYKGQSGNLSPFDVEHAVPSPRWGAYLHERVDERERKAAEMSFRVTLAVALVPVAFSLGLEGGGLWWLSVVAIPFVWLDVALMKYTTLRTVRRYQIEDLQSELDRAISELMDAERPDEPQQLSDQQRARWEDRKRQRVEELRATVNELEARIERLSEDATRRLPRLFALFEGEPAE